MIVVDPVTLGDVAFSRASPKWVWDKTGTLVEVPANTLAVTYDPSDLSKPPYALIEPEAKNFVSASHTLTDWWTGNPSVTPSGVFYGSLPYQTLTKTTSVANENRANVWGATAAGQKFVCRLALRAGTSTTFDLGLYDTLTTGWGPGDVTAARIVSGPGAVAKLSGSLTRVTGLSPSVDTLVEIERTFSVAANAGILLYPGGNNSTTFGASVLVTRIQAEMNQATSYIPTGASLVTRAADVIGTTAGLLYSNVAEPEPLWMAGTYAKGAKVRDAAHVVYESLVDGNTAALPSKTDANWLRLGATNRYAMFDDRNNTQTTNPEEIVVALSPRAIAQGLLLGNLDATEIGIAVTVPNFGVVYREKSSLVVSTSNSSFFRWAFNRIRRKTLFLSLNLPIFFNGVVTVTIRRPGGIAKCGMCLIGPIIEVGSTLVGLTTETKDYSTTLFYTDGSSETTVRGYRKLMSLDVSIDSDEVELAEEQMITWRQKTAVWIGATSRRDSILVGRYSSFKKVIESYPRSKMALQIEGVLS